MACWTTADDIDLIVEDLLENAESSSMPDAIANALLGLKQLHEMRARKTFDIYSKLVEDRKFVYTDEDDY